MIQLSAEELIEYVRNKHGLQLSTQKQRHPFAVRVAGDGLEYVPLGTGKPRAHELKWLRRVCDKFSLINAFRPIDYNEFTVNASYTLALIQAYLDSAVLEPEVQISGGGFASPETRKEIEVAAIAFVTRELSRRGFQVEDHQCENRGYDLLANSSSSKLLVEVKGTDAPDPRFFLTRNEWRSGSKQKEWRLFVVCKARSVPLLYEYTSDEMHRQFTLDPLAWECTRKPLLNT